MCFLIYAESPPVKSVIIRPVHLAIYHRLAFVNDGMEDKINNPKPPKFRSEYLCQDERESSVNARVCEQRLGSAFIEGTALGEIHP